MTQRYSTCAAIWKICVTHLHMEESHSFCTSVIFKDWQIVQPTGVIALDSLGLLGWIKYAAAAWPDPKWATCTKNCIDKSRWGEAPRAERLYAIQPCKWEFIPKEKPTAGVVLGINKVRKTCWKVPAESWVPETEVTVWLMQMIVLILLGMLFS